MPARPIARAGTSTPKDLRRYSTATGARIEADHAFCEPLEIVYEYGVLGLGLLVAFGWFVGGHRSVADPESVALLVWALTMMGSITLLACNGRVRTGPTPPTASA